MKSRELCKSMDYVVKHKAHSYFWMSFDGSWITVFEEQKL